MPKSCNVTKLFFFYVIFKKKWGREKRAEPGGSEAVCATEFVNIGLC